MRNTAAYLLVILLFFACHQAKKSDVSKIEFAKSACFGGCVPVAISIDSALNFKFYADSAFSWDKPAHTKVSYVGKVSRKFWNDLISNLDSIDYKHTDTSKKIYVMDAQHTELFVYWGKQKTKIRWSGKKVDSLIAMIDNSYKQVKLVPTIDTLHFGTTLQIPERLRRFK